MNSLRYKVLASVVAGFLVFTLHCVIASKTPKPTLVPARSVGLTREAGGVKIIARYTPRQSASAVAASRCGDYYRVRKGDTLARIARKCSVRPAKIKRWNGLTSNRIRVNWVLVLQPPVQKKDTAVKDQNVLAPLDDTLKKALPIPAFN